MLGVYNLYTLANNLYKKRIPIFPKIIQKLIRIIYGCYIPYESNIGKGTRFIHEGLGVVIHQKATIGKNCFINTSVVIGGSNHKKVVPKIGNNVYIGTGVIIVGEVSIGNNVAIGANSVVVNDIPDGCLVVGTPAKIIKKNIDIKDYL